MRLFDALMWILFLFTGFCAVWGSLDLAETISEMASKT